MSYFTRISILGLSAQNEPAAKSAVKSDKKQPTKCTFSGVVPIEFSRFLESGIALVECPDCASTRTLEPRGGGPAVQISRQTQNAHSHYRAKMGHERNDLGRDWRREEVSKQAHDIIVIGASAGGVTALATLVAKLPDDLRAALFMVVHIPATLPSALPQILNRSGPLPACHATEGMRIEMGKIYVAPPDYHLLVEPGSVHLGTGPKERHFRPAVT
jgi:chemotaxis response regulator CheB